LSFYFDVAVHVSCPSHWEQTDFPGTIKTTEVGKTLAIKRVMRETIYQMDDHIMLVISNLVR